MIVAECNWTLEIMQKSLLKVYSLKWMHRGVNVPRARNLTHKLLNIVWSGEVKLPIWFRFLRAHTGQQDVERNACRSSAAGSLVDVITNHLGKVSRAGVFCEQTKQTNKKKDGQLEDSLKKRRRINQINRQAQKHWTNNHLRVQQRMDNFRNLAVFGDSLRCVRLF